MSLNTNITNLQNILDKVNTLPDTLPEVGQNYPEVVVNVELNEKTYIWSFTKVSIVDGQAIEDTQYLENKPRVYSFSIPAGTYFRLRTDSDDWNYNGYNLSASYENFIDGHFENCAVGQCCGSPIKDVTITGGYKF